MRERNPEAAFLRDLPFARRVVLALKDAAVAEAKNHTGTIRIVQEPDGSLWPVPVATPMQDAYRLASGYLVDAVTTYMQGDDAGALVRLVEVAKCLPEFPLLGVCGARGGSDAG
jgi:hypothetical protein